MLIYFKDWDNAAEIGMQYMKCVIGILFKNNQREYFSLGSRDWYHRLFNLRVLRCPLVIP